MSNWIPSAKNPGYIEKTIKSGAATITILRPILSEEEKAKRTEDVRATLESVMREHYKRTAYAR